MAFLEELKRRKVIQVAAVYAVVAWLLVQIVATVEAPLKLPEWVDTLVIVLLAVGFPIALIVSRGFNLTAAGLQREEGTAATLQKPGLKIEYALIGLLIVVMLWVLYRVEFQRPELLIDGDSGAHLWTEAYDGDLSDIFGFQTNIASRIAASLEAELLPETRARLEKPPTDSPAAYALLLQAKSAINNGNFTRAISLLDRAIATDPRFAAAYAYRSWQGAWTLVNTTVAATDDPATLRALEEQVIADAQLALALDENLAHAWLARATLNRVRFRWKTAAEEYAHAYALSPNDSNVLGDYGSFKSDLGECDQAMALSRRSVELNPNDLLPYAWLVLSAHVCHNYEAALLAAERMFELAPGNPVAINMMGVTRLPKRNVTEAARCLRTAEQLLTDDLVTMLPGQIYSYGLLGLDDDASRAYERYKPWTDRLNVGAGEWIFSYLGTGDPDSAYEWLQRAVVKVESGERDASYLSFMLVKENVHKDPTLDEPRFRESFDRIDAIAKSR